MTTARIVLKCFKHVQDAYGKDSFRKIVGGHRQKDNAELHFRIFQCWTKLNDFFGKTSIVPNSSNSRFCVT